MPKVLVGRKPNGQKKELGFPSELFGPDGHVAWKEWAVRNGNHDSAPHFFGADGKKAGAANHGLILDAKGRPLNGARMDLIVARQELAEMLSKKRKTQEQFKWMGKRTRNSLLVLQKLADLEPGKENAAISMLWNDPLFRTALMTGRITPPREGKFTIGLIKGQAYDFLLPIIGAATSGRKKELDFAEKRTNANARMIR